MLHSIKMFFLKQLAVIIKQKYRKETLTEAGLRNVNAHSGQEISHQYKEFLSSMK